MILRELFENLRTFFKVVWATTEKRYGPPLKAMKSGCFLRCLAAKCKSSCGGHHSKAFQKESP